MDLYADQDLFFSEIKKLFDDLNSTIISEKESAHRRVKKWDMSTIGPDIEISKLSGKELREFQIDNCIKIKPGNLTRWNPKYKAEALNFTYPLVLNNLENLNQKLKRETLKNLGKPIVRDYRKFEVYLDTQIRHFYNLIGTNEGAAYCYDDERHSINNLHKSKFDVIWDCNEVFHIFPLMLREGNPINYPQNSEYPFVHINIQQWMDFESAYRLIPLLENIKSILKNELSIKIEKYSPKYNIDNVIIKANRFPELFKSAQVCEFFFYFVQMAPINNIVDWTYIHQVFKEDNGFTTKEKPKDYFNLINEVYSKDLKRLRKDTTNSRYDYWVGLYIKNKKSFDNLVKVNKQKG